MHLKKKKNDENRDFRKSFEKLIGKIVMMSPNGDSREKVWLFKLHYEQVIQFKTENSSYESSF